MFELAHVDRRALHEQYGGNDQAGISPLAHHPAILLFTGESGRQHGYLDHWEDDGTFRYYGEGQVGDKEFRPGGGNIAVRDHTAAGRDLHLFDSHDLPRGHVRYIGPMVCAGFAFEEGVPDRNGTPRRAIIFHLAPASVEQAGLSWGADSGADATAPDVVTPTWYWAQPLAVVRAAAS